MRVLPLLLMFPVYASLAEEPVRVLTLKQSIEIAQKVSLDADSAERSLTQKNLRVRSAWSALLPTLNFDSSFGVGRIVIPRKDPQNPWRSRLGLSVSQTLYDNGVTFSNISIARINRDSETLKQRFVRNRLSADVLKAYRNVCLVTALQTLRESQFALLSGEFKKATSRYTQGLIPKRDWLRLDADVQRSAIDLESSKERVKQAEMRFREVMGPEFSEKISWQCDPLADDPKLPPLPNEIAEPTRSPEYQASLLDFKVSDESIDQARRRLWPELSLTARGQYGNTGFVRSGEPYYTTNSVDWEVTLGLTYNLLDWGVRSRALRIEQEAQIIQSNGLRNKLLSLKSQSQNLFSEIKQLERAHNLNVELLKREIESSKLVENEYRQGRLSYLDLSSSRRTILDARSSVITTYYQILENLVAHHLLNGDIDQYVQTL